MLAAVTSNDANQCRSHLTAFQVLDHVGRFGKRNHEREFLIARGVDNGPSRLNGEPQIGGQSGRSRARHRHIVELHFLALVLIGAPHNIAERHALGGRVGTLGFRMMRSFGVVFCWGRPRGDGPDRGRFGNFFARDGTRTRTQTVPGGPLNSRIGKELGQTCAPLRSAGSPRSRRSQELADFRLPIARLARRGVLFVEKGRDPFLNFRRLVALQAADDPPYFLGKPTSGCFPLLRS